jgi:hypothetical protein
MKPRALTLALANACTMTACAPTLDWRDVRPDGAGLSALFPCKPTGAARRLALAGTAVEMTLYACSAGDVTYAVGFADVGQPLLVEPALAELSAAAARNIGATVPTAVAPLRIAGMTPNPRAGCQSLFGQLGDGRRVEVQVALFVRGTRVFQATIVGPRLDAVAIETFFGSLQLYA